MSIKISVQGVEITVSTATEAAEFVRALTATQPPKQTEPQTPREPAPGTSSRPRIHIRPRPVVQNGFDVHSVTINFLEALAAHHEGLGANQIMPIMRAEHAKGIGARAAKINKLIESTGHKRHDVYSNERNDEGVRLWKPEPRLRAALDAVKADKHRKG